MHGLGQFGRRLPNDILFFEIEGAIVVAMEGLVVVVMVVVMVMSAVVVVVVVVAVVVVERDNGPPPPPSHYTITLIDHKFLSLRGGRHQHASTP